MSASYVVENFRTYRVNEDGERELLANFSAKIVEETRYVDGRTTDTFLTLEGEGPSEGKEPYKYQQIRIPASAFQSMTWVLPSWGVKAVVHPGSSIKDDLRTAIQLNSKPLVTVIYRYIGWAEVNAKPAYLHAGGAITAKGNDPQVKVELPQELSRYYLEVGDKSETKEAVQATLELTRLAPNGIGWTMLAAIISPLHGAVDFAVHLTGRTGTFKSEITSLFQSHYGSEMDARHLPGSWSSTANALEAQAYYAANAPFAVDDFVPTGTSWQVRAYQTTADKLIRAQGNQSGRARLTDMSNLQTAMYPRGIVISTGEDTPEGHSVRARMMIMELTPGDITPENLTKCQNLREWFPYTIGGYIQYLCGEPYDPREDAKIIRDQNLKIGHSRTPAMLGRLIASVTAFLKWAEKIGAIKKGGSAKLIEDASKSIIGTADKQNQYLESADPVDQFTSAIRQALGTGLGHVRKLDGGIPKGADTLGWTNTNGEYGDVPMFKSLGPCIGWIDWERGELYLDQITGMTVVKKVLGQDMTLSKQTLFKRLKDAGVITRVDEARQRNTIRVTADRHPRQVLCLNIPQLLETQEEPNDESGSGSEDSGQQTGGGSENEW